MTLGIPMQTWLNNKPGKGRLSHVFYLPAHFERTLFLSTAMCDGYAQWVEQVHK